MSDLEFTPDEESRVESSPSPLDETAPAPVVVRRRKSIFRDPMVRRMAIFAIILVVLYLVTVVSALLLGVLGQTAPKTAVQSDIQYYESQAMRTPKDSKVWKEYIGALMQAEQYMKAQEVIDRATKVIDQSRTQDFLYLQSELYFATGDYKKAIKTADKVRELLKKHYDAAKKKADTPESKKEPINDNYYLALIVKAESQLKLGDEKGAVESFTLFLKDNSTAADVFVRRGDIKAKLGDKKGAEADFREALKYIPDDPQAIAGLDKIGVSR